MSPPSWLRLNVKLLPVKVTYFCLLGGVSSLLPYLNLYMNQIGLTMSEIGIIYGTMPFVSAIMRTVIGGVADKFQKHKLILMICCVVSGLAHLTLYWVPPNPVSMKMSCETDLQHMRFRCCSSSLGNNTSTCVGEDISTINTTHPLVCAPTQNTKNPKDCSVICSKLDLSPSDACAADNISSPADVTALSLQCPSAVFSSSSNQISFSVKELVASSYPMCSCLDYELSGIQLEDVAYRSGSCGEAFTTSCTVDCDVNRPQCELLTVENTTLCAQDTKQVPEVKPPLFGLTFALFFIIYLIGSLAFNPIFSLIDALVYANLRKVGGEWGPQRMWGTVAFAIFAVIAGFMMDIFGTGNNEKNFLFSFVSYAVSQFLAGLLVCFYRISQEVKCANLMKNMGNLLCRVDVLVLLFSIFLFGCYTGLIETCLYVNLFGLGGTGLLVGICMVVNCIPEILILLFAGTIITKFGYFTCMTISYAAYTARVLGYAFIRNPWLVLILEPLHGITFGLMYATVTSHGSLITPPGMHGTIQSLIGALYFGFGKGVGSVAGGQVYHFAGPFRTFLGFGLSSGIFMIAYILIYAFYLRKKPIGQDSPQETVDKDQCKAEDAAKETDIPMLPETAPENITCVNSQVDETQTQNGLLGSKTEDDPTV